MTQDFYCEEFIGIYRQIVGLSGRDGECLFGPAAASKCLLLWRTSSISVTVQSDSRSRTDWTGFWIKVQQHRKKNLSGFSQSFILFHNFMIVCLKFWWNRKQKGDALKLWQWIITASLTHINNYQTGSSQTVLSPQSKYKEGRRRLSQSFYSQLPETAETQFAKSVAELQSEVRPSYSNEYRSTRRLTTQKHLTEH